MVLFVLLGVCGGIASVIGSVFYLHEKCAEGGFHEWEDVSSKTAQQWIPPVSSGRGSICTREGYHNDYTIYTRKCKKCGCETTYTVGELDNSQCLDVW